PEIAGKQGQAHLFPSLYRTFILRHIRQPCRLHPGLRIVPRRPPRKPSARAAAHGRFASTMKLVQTFAIARPCEAHLTMIITRRTDLRPKLGKFSSLPKITLTEMRRTGCGGYEISEISLAI